MKKTNKETNTEAMSPVMCLDRNVGSLQQRQRKAYKLPSQFISHQLDSLTQGLTGLSTLTVLIPAGRG